MKLEQIARLMYEHRHELECGDSGCWLLRREELTGMRTNGLCRCLDPFNGPSRSLIAMALRELTGR